MPQRLRDGRDVGPRPVRGLDRLRHHGEVLARDDDRLVGVRRRRALVVEVGEHDRVAVCNVLLAEPPAGALPDDVEQRVHVSLRLHERVLELLRTARLTAEPPSPVVADVVAPLHLEHQDPALRVDHDEVGLALQERVAAPRPQPRVGVQDRVVVAKLISQRDVHGLLGGVLEIARRDVGVHPRHHAPPRGWNLTVDEDAERSADDGDVVNAALPRARRNLGRYWIFTLSPRRSANPKVHRSFVALNAGVQRSRSSRGVLLLHADREVSRSGGREDNPGAC